MGANVQLDTRQWAALGLGQFTSAVMFARRILAMNRFRWPPTHVHLVAYIVSVFTGLMFWTTLNALTLALAEQMLFGATYTTLSWLVVCLVVNERLQFPTRQQWLSYVFYLITETSILLQVRFIVS